MKSSFALLFSASLLLLNACKKDNNTSADAIMSVYLTDDPSKYDKVLIDIQSVEINDGSGWHPLHVLSPGIHNLLNFRNGKDTILASSRLAQRRISQIRLILGTNNSVVVEGQKYPLE